MLYVDDILLTSSDLDILYETKCFLLIKFKMNDLYEVFYVKGIEIYHDRLVGS
jgi:hypothetical protein